MGYGGKIVERERARKLRAQSWTLQEIADELGVAKGSVSVWVRDVEFTPKPRNRGHSGHQPHPLHVKKLAEIEQCRAEAEAILGQLTERDLRMFAVGSTTASISVPRRRIGARHSTSPRFASGGRTEQSTTHRAGGPNMSTAARPSCTPARERTDV